MLEGHFDIFFPVHTDDTEYLHMYYLPINIVSWLHCSIRNFASSQSSSKRRFIYRGLPRSMCLRNTTATDGGSVENAGRNFRPVHPVHTSFVCSSALTPVSLYLGNCSRRYSTSSILGVVLLPCSRAQTIYITRPCTSSLRTPVLSRHTVLPVHKKKASEEAFFLKQSCVTYFI